MKLKKEFNQLEGCARCRNRSKNVFFQPTVYFTEAGITYMKCPKCGIRYKMVLEYQYVF